MYHLNRSLRSRSTCSQQSSWSQITWLSATSSFKPMGHVLVVVIYWKLLCLPALSLKWLREMNYFVPMYYRSSVLLYTAYSYMVLVPRRKARNSARNIGNRQSNMFDRDLRSYINIKLSELRTELSVYMVPQYSPAFMTLTNLFYNPFSPPKWSCLTLLPIGGKFECETVDIWFCCRQSESKNPEGQTIEFKGFNVHSLVDSMKQRAGIKTFSNLEVLLAEIRYVPSLYEEDVLVAQWSSWYQVHSSALVSNLARLYFLLIYFLS